jgi:hypothetical protein
MALMYDACNPHEIPRDAAVVGGYVDGICAADWPDSVWAQFTGALVRISSTGVNDGLVLDVEPGNPNAAFARGWIQMRQAAGVARPAIYVSAHPRPPGFNLADVQRECAGLGYDLWVEEATGVPHLYPGSVATQYAVSSQTGHDYDLSITNGSWPVSGSLIGAVDGMWHPTIPGRFDDIVVGTDGHIYHLFGTSPTALQVESWGGTGIPGSERWGWSPDGQHLLVRVDGLDGQLWYRQLNLSGAVELDWTAAAGQFEELPLPGPIGPPGPAGAPGVPGGLDPAQVKADVHAALQTAADALKGP